MLPEQAAHMIWILLAILLVGSGLVARRISWGKSTALVASWIGLILVMWALVLAARAML